MDDRKGSNSNKAFKLYQEGLKKLGSMEYYEAIIALNRAANLDSEKPIYWLELGVAFNRVSLFDLAIIAFDRVLSLEAGNEMAQFGKAVAMRRLSGQVRFYAGMGWKHLKLSGGLSL